MMILDVCSSFRLLDQNCVRVYHFSQTCCMLTPSHNMITLIALGISINYDALCRRNSVFATSLTQ
jgi:hypothetical protein